MRRLSITFCLCAIALLAASVHGRGSRSAAAPPLAALWEQPTDLPARDLFAGPWGMEHAPDPLAEYLFLRPKTRGINPGVVVADPSGRQWHVKQRARNDAGSEGRVEVVLSRILAAVGYHQPPVYFLGTFTMNDRSGTRTTPGGRFRLDMPSLKDEGAWSWKYNPFVGTLPYQGLLTILLLFNATDLKDSNNTLYASTTTGGVRHWYVVRDLGAALGDTSRFAPKKGDPDRFERSRFITGVSDGFVEFANRSPYRSLYRRRITPSGAQFGAQLLARLDERQWHDAFRAGGYSPEVARRFLRKIRLNIGEAAAVGSAAGSYTRRRISM